MKNFVHLLILMLILSNQLTAQTTTFRGKIVDESTKQAISYATVEVKNQGKGVATDDSGTFTLNYAIQKQQADTLLFKALGYKTRAISVKSYPKYSFETIALTPLIFELSQVVVKPRTRKLIKGIDIPNTAPSYSLALGNIVAVFMENEKQHTGVIQSVSFFIVKQNAKFKAPFRVRFYEADENGFPGKDLIAENIIVQAKKKNAWLDIDVSEHNIPIPSNGFFVAMEWIYTDKKYSYETRMSNEIKIQLYGQSLGRTIKSEKPITFIGKLGYNRWRKDDLLYKGKYGNALIRSTILID